VCVREIEREREREGERKESWEHECRMSAKGILSRKKFGNGRRVRTKLIALRHTRILALSK